MPEPFAIPPIRTPESSSTATSFGTRSVVMIAFAALIEPVASAVRFSYTSSICPSIQSMSRGTPMTPVDAIAIPSGDTPTFLASISAIVRASFKPTSPVKALAQPLLAMIPSRCPPPRCSSVIIHGAAIILFLVKRPAAVPFPSIIERPYFCPFFLIPYARTPLGAQIPPSITFIFLYQKILFS